MRQSLKTKRNYQIIFGVACLLIIASFIYFQGGNLIAKPYLEGKLKSFADNMAAQAAQSGDIANFTYDGIEIKGNFFKKTALIKNPKLEYTARLPFGNIQRTDISTPVAEVSAAQLAAQTIYVDFPEPFSVERNGYAAIKVSFSGKPRYAYSQNKVEDMHAILLPDSVKLSPENAKDKPVEVTLSYNNPKISRSINRATGNNTTSISFDNISITSNIETKKMQVGSVSGSSQESRQEDNRRAFASKFDINNLTVTNADVVHGPYQFNLDVSGNYVLPDFAANPQAMVNDIEIALNNVLLKTNDYSVQVKGNLSQKPDDQMYSGSADVAILGLDVFRNSEFMPNIDPALKDALITAVIGNADPATKEASISLKREKLGTFYIGQTTFENLIGIIITYNLSKAQQNPGSGVTMTPIPENAAPPAQDIPEPQNPIVTPQPQ